MADQEDIVAGKGDLGGTMRLGAYPAMLEAGSIVAEVYGTTEVDERHRHRYEVNNAYRDALTKAGLDISGTSPDGRLVEFVELDRALHPYFVATQAHPELKSRPTRPHPLFAGSSARPRVLRRRTAAGRRSRRPRSAPRDRRQPRATVLPVRRTTTRSAAGTSTSPAPSSRWSPTRSTMPDGGHADRDFMRHVGAVGVVALDDDGRVVLVRQYRHPVGTFLWELPAGLIDVTGEHSAAAAARELAEEADLTAARLELLVDMHTTPGAPTR